VIAPVFESLDGPEYARAAEQVELAAHIGSTVSAGLAARPVATVEATRRIVDQLRDGSGLTDLLRHDWEGAR
jgi:hypothetical protein